MKIQKTKVGNNYYLRGKKGKFKGEYESKSAAKKAMKRKAENVK